MQKRINWTEIYIFYISSEIITLRDCAEKFQISYDVVRRKSSDQKWRQKKKESRQVALRIVEEKISTKIAKINERHVQIGQALQSKGIKAMIEGEILPANARDTQGWISAGIAIERKALGMNNPNQQQKIEPIEETTEKYILEGEKSEKK